MIRWSDNLIQYIYDHLEKSTLAPNW